MYITFEGTFDNICNVFNFEGTCVYYSLTTALRAANRACGLEIGELSWEELCEMVSQDEPCRIRALLHVLKYHGIRTEVDYRMVCSGTGFTFGIELSAHLYVIIVNINFVP